MNERQQYLYESVRSNRIFLLLQMLEKMTDTKEIEILVDNLNEGGDVEVEIEYDVEYLDDFFDEEIEEY